MNFNNFARPGNRCRAFWKSNNGIDGVTPFLHDGDFIISENKNKQGELIGGCPVCSPDALLEMQGKPFVIVLGNNNGSVRNKLLKMGYVEHEDFESNDSLAEEVRQTSPYDEFLRRYGQITEHDMQEMRADIAGFKMRPVISVLLPVYNTPEKILREAIDSVISQSYPYWELCISDDASTDVSVKKVLQEYSAKDSRIKYVIRKENGNISQNSNTALTLVTGEWTALLDHDDTLLPEALYMIAKEINTANDEVDLIYTDEDQFLNGHRYYPHFKYDVDMSLILGLDYLVHLNAYRTSILRKCGAFRLGYELSQDYDLALRFLKHTDRSKIRHIPRVCYTYRVWQSSSVKNQKHAFDIQRKVLVDYLGGRPGIRVTADKNHGYMFNVSLPMPSIMSNISIILLISEMSETVQGCVEDILERTNYESYDIWIIDNNGKKDKNDSWPEEVSEHKKIHVIKTPRHLNNAELYNYAAAKVTGELILFFSMELKIKSDDWLLNMVKCLEIENVGIVGARILDNNGDTRSFGMLLGKGGIASASWRSVTKKDFFYTRVLDHIHETSAVDISCMLVKREVFEAISGFDGAMFPIHYCDVDFCLRARRAGWIIIAEPRSELYFLTYDSESNNHKNDESEERLARHQMFERYGAELLLDPYYSPNLSLEKVDFSAAKYPRVGKAWRPWTEFVCPFPKGETLLGIQAAYLAHKRGVKVRLHVASELMSWISDFHCPFPVEPVPVAVPRNGKDEKAFDAACDYVACREDSSGLIVGTWPHDEFGNYGLNIVEYLLFQLRLPIEEKLPGILPKARILSNEDAATMRGQVAIISLKGDKPQTSLPFSLAEKIIDILCDEGWNVVQIGNCDEEQVSGCHGYIMKNSSLGYWRSVFDKSSLIVTADSWVSHFAALLDIPQIAIYQGTSSRDYFSQPCFTERQAFARAFDGIDFDEEALKNIISARKEKGSRSV